MFKTTTLLGMATMVSTAAAGTSMLDQIGASDGSDVDTSNILASQYFEAAFSVYDIAAIDDFDNTDGLAATSVAACIAGWNGYTSIDAVLGVEGNFYLAIEDAAANLDGYATASGPVVLDPNWTGQANGEVVVLDSYWALAGGVNLVTLIPVNEFGTNGQTGITASFLGDGAAWQANPGGGFGMPNNWQAATNNVSIRVVGETGDPCSVPFGNCPTDVSGPAGTPDGFVGVDDILACVGTFNETGNGTERPQGDCYPDPAGDCTVNVDDLLSVVATFGTDCRPRGACCFGIAGCDEDTLEEDCSSGDWLGEDSTCADCHAGACCYIDGTCTEGSPADCSNAGGTYSGDGIDCASANCPQPSEGACCITNLDCLDSLFPADCDDFGGTYMGAGTDCMTASCGWEGCPSDATAEDAPCAEDTSDPNSDPNGGLNVDPPLFGAIANGETICGTISTFTCIGCADDGTDATYRDTDWYVFDNSAGGEWTISGGGETSLVMGIVDNDALAFVDYFILAPYEEGSATVTLPAGGSYSVWVGFDFDGGTNPCSSNTNEYSISLSGAAAPPSACCVVTDCVGDLNPTECAQLGGTYVADESCDTYSCPQAFVPCNTGNGQDPLGIDDSWTAGTSDTGSGYQRAMGVSADSISECTIYGLGLLYSGGWSNCSTPADMPMEWAIYADASGMPGSELASGASVDYAGTDLVYAGAYALHGWTCDMSYTGSVDWVNISSVSAGQGECWFLWMSSTPADAGASAINDGTGWIAEAFNLNYCITE
jgi:hypothetical protein